MFRVIGMRACRGRARPNDDHVVAFHLVPFSARRPVEREDSHGRSEPSCFVHILALLIRGLAHRPTLKMNPKFK
jgi:hypothetical protein